MAETRATATRGRVNVSTEGVDGHMAPLTASCWVQLHVGAQRSSVGVGVGAFATAAPRRPGASRRGVCVFVVRQELSVCSRVFGGALAVVGAGGEWQPGSCRWCLELCGSFQSFGSSGMSASHSTGRTLAAGDSPAGRLMPPPTGTEQVAARPQVLRPFAPNSTTCTSQVPRLDHFTTCQTTATADKATSSSGPRPPRVRNPQLAGRNLRVYDIARHHPTIASKLAHDKPAAQSTPSCHRCSSAWQTEHRRPPCRGRCPRHSTTMCTRRFSPRAASHGSAAAPLRKLAHATSRDFYNERPMQKVVRKIKEEPLVPLGASNVQPTATPAMRLVSVG